MSEKLPPPGLTSDAKVWAIFCHLSLFLGLGLLVPILILLAKHDDAFVAAHAREALNFHLSLYIYSLAATVAFILLLLTIIGLPLALLGLVAVCIVGVVAGILAIVATALAANGGCYRYPLTLHIVR